MDLKGLHNIFPLAYAEAPYRKFQEYNNMRGLTHTREGYAGIQRYPYIWAGDWGSEWQWFEPVIRAGLNIGMSGVGNWTHCIFSLRYGIIYPLGTVRYVFTYRYGVRYGPSPLS